MWNFNPAEIATNELYAIRQEIGDTDPLDPQLTDEAIVWAASQERNFWGASARCMEMIARVKLRKADVRLGRALMITYTKMADRFLAQSKSLRQKSMGTVSPFIGGMSVTDKMVYSQNTDLVAPLFTKTMMENPWTGGYTTDSLSPISEGQQITNEDENI